MLFEDGSPELLCEQDDACDGSPKWMRWAVDAGPSSAYMSSEESLVASAFCRYAGGEEWGWAGGASKIVGTGCSCGEGEGSCCTEAVELRRDCDREGGSELDGVGEDRPEVRPSLGLSKEIDDLAARERMLVRLPRR